MKISEIEAALPNGTKLPKPIADICEFHEKYSYPISGCFELSKIGMDSLKGWFGKNVAVPVEFLPFGRGASGDVYALWLTEGLTPECAPVVMFGSEGEQEVLAINAIEFCRLLCLGYSEIGHDDPSSEPTEFVETANFRAFILEKYNFQLPSVGKEIIDEAEEKFPHLRARIAALSK